MTDTTEYYDIAIPQGPNVPSEVTQAFIELNDKLMRMSERLNDLTTRVAALESA